MLEQVKERIMNISSEVNELHPLLEELFQRHSKISRVEYTHGVTEMGADFVLSRIDDILNTTEYVGVVAKKGKIHVDLDSVERQVWECTNVPRKIDGGKKEIILSQVWVISTGSITNGAKDKIHAKYPGTNVHFIDADQLSSMVNEYIPSYWSEVDLPVSIYLNDTKVRSEELDASFDLTQLQGEPIYIDQDIVQVDTDPYHTGKSQKNRKAKRVNIEKEIADNRFLLIEADMGGGKSKFLRNMTQHYADVATFQKEKILPVPATFREVVDDYGGDLRLVLEDKVSYQAREIVTQDVQYLFLIDAVDEKDMMSEDLSKTLMEFTNTLNEEKCYRLLLTSRHISNVDFDKQFSHNLARYEIAQLSMGKIVKFLDTVCRRLNIHTRVIEDLQRSQLFDRLPRNPIAAILLGQLLAENQQELPLTMTELYEKYMELALGRWDMKKGLQSQQEFETLENVLMDLAEYMLENELEMISSKEVEERFRKYLNERNLKVKVEQLIDRAVRRADVLTRSSDGHSIWFKHRSFAEFLYAKWLRKNGKLEPNLRAFEIYWASTYFFGLGLQKDAPELLEGLIDLPTETDGQRWMKMFGLADFLMAAYLTPYWVINKGVHCGALEAARLFRDAAEGEARNPFAGLSRMHLLYFIQLLMRDNYGYEFLGPALEEAAMKLVDGNEDPQIRAYALFLASVAYIDAGHGHSFEWLLEEFDGYLPLDLRFAVWHEGEKLETRNKALKKLRRNINATLRDSTGFREEARKMHEQPIASLERKEEGDSLP